MKFLLILNDPPYGSERVYNALRLAGAVQKHGHVTIFLMADSVVAAKKGQKTPDGYYNTERMLKKAILGGAEVLLCGTCMDARGMTAEDLMEGAARSTLDALSAATLEADKVLVF